MLINGSFLRHPDAARDIARATLRLTARRKSADDPQRREALPALLLGREARAHALTRPGPTPRANHRKEPRYL